MSNHTCQTNLEIAGFTLTLLSNRLVELEDGYLPFIQQQVNPENDIVIECFAGIPTNLFRPEDLVFEAKNSEQRFYSIYKINNELGFIIYNQQTRDEIQQIAILNNDFKHWKVYMEETDGKILPLKYPLGPIIMHYMTLKADAVMMHASCAFDGVKARIFSGFSGAGKSTMSKIWSEARNQIINDDRLIIRKQGDDYVVYNTPMYYQDIPKKAALSSVYLISHSPENKISKLNGAMAVSRMMAFSIQNNFDKQYIQSRLNFFSELCSKIPVYDLGFVPDGNVVNFIKDNESKEFE